MRAQNDSFNKVEKHNRSDMMPQEQGQFKIGKD